MKKTFIFLTIILFFLTVKSFAYDFDGVLTSKPSISLDVHRKEKLKSEVEAYVQQILLNLTIKKVGNVIERATQNTEAQLMPDFAYVAAQQGALQCFKQPSTLEVIREVFDNVYASAMDEFDQGVDANAVQQHIYSDVEVGLEALVDDFAFRQIVEVVVQNALQNQQMYVQQKTFEQGLKSLGSQKQEVQQALQEEYKKSLGSVLVK